MKRKYNALYRLRKKGFKVISNAKTIITPPHFSGRKRDENINCGVSFRNSVGTILN